MIGGDAVTRLAIAAAIITVSFGSAAAAGGMPVANADAGNAVTLFVGAAGKNVTGGNNEKDFRSFVTEINKIGKGIIQIKYVGYVDKKTPSLPPAAPPGRQAGSSGKSTTPHRYDFLFLPKDVYLSKNSFRKLRRSTVTENGPVPDAGLTVEPEYVAATFPDAAGSDRRPSVLQRAWRSGMSNLAAWGTFIGHHSVSAIETIRNARLVIATGEFVSTLWTESTEMVAGGTTRFAQLPLIKPAVELFAQGWSVGRDFVTAKTRLIASSATVTSVMIELTSLGEPVMSATDSLFGWVSDRKKVTFEYWSHDKNPETASLKPSYEAEVSQAVPAPMIIRAADAGLPKPTDISIRTEAKKRIFTTNRHPAELTKTYIDGPALQFTNTLVINLSRWNALPVKARDIITKALVEHKIGSISAVTDSLKGAENKNKGSSLAGTGGEDYRSMGYVLWRKRDYLKENKVLPDPEKELGQSDLRL